ncbi:hypothetical protein NM688_g9414 [Phlebia brevispora]|uniref:Uncharacterized protein n=1 Tax=Phlebia brevispora TaxID=194682 RepID=A0ACC1RHT8_9APHY|nr:hypothetical protein NM688_g9414 [Phlebia brevispora]
MFAILIIVNFDSRFALNTAASPHKLTRDPTRTRWQTPSAPLDESSALLRDVDEQRLNMRPSGRRSRTYPAPQRRTLRANSSSGLPSDTSTLSRSSSSAGTRQSRLVLHNYHVFSLTTGNEMTVSVRQCHVSVIFFLLLAFVTSAYAFPLSLPNSEGIHSLTRRGTVIAYDDFGRIENITDSSTGQPIAQGNATDGSGVDFDASAIIWIVLSFVVGLPLMFGGLAVSRITTGCGIGLAATVCIWASFANTTSATGVADLIITLISLGSFVIGFLIGVFEVGHYAGLTLMAFLGGFSVGVRIVLFRDGLVVHRLFGNWLIITGLGLLAFLLVVLKQRAAVVICSSAVGTFMTGLGIDLAIYKQNGMSLGLRYLFDRNASHMEASL